ncbi:Uncharacterised protein [Serratia entomophila]|nr:Uncharacterised protein [Serratia entomophila]CAI1050305.1 Uncharacterised protein [Serratia entomophila]CAI1058625.1 Uncharacterised protein [Serratia entomophila]CAI1059327.1 Uncharacterised protein [Serratia entomophila]CAI1059540.1 Uncharacterised protein [Serratia entomophila]
MRLPIVAVNKIHTATPGHRAGHIAADIIKKVPPNRLRPVFSLSLISSNEARRETVMRGRGYFFILICRFGRNIRDSKHFIAGPTVLEVNITVSVNTHTGRRCRTGLPVKCYAVRYPALPVIPRCSLFPYFPTLMLSRVHFRNTQLIYHGGVWRHFGWVAFLAVSQFWRHHQGH